MIPQYWPWSLNLYSAAFCWGVKGEPIEVLSPVCYKNALQKFPGKLKTTLNYIGGWSSLSATILPNITRLAKDLAFVGSGVGLVVRVETWEVMSSTVAVVGTWFPCSCNRPWRTALITEFPRGSVRSEGPRTTTLSPSMYMWSADRNPIPWKNGPTSNVKA